MWTPPDRMGRRLRRVVVSLCVMALGGVAAAAPSGPLTSEAAPLGLKVSPGLRVEVAHGASVLNAIVTVRPAAAAAGDDGTRPLAVRRDASRLAIDALIADYGTRGLIVRQRFPHLPLVAVTVPADLLEAIAADSRVIGVTASRRFEALDSEGDALMHVHEVRTDGYSGRGVGIAVLDTGVDDTQPELAPGGYDATVKTVRFYDAVDHVGDTSDHEGHGTAVAGIAAGSQTGVAPDARVVAVRVLDVSGSGTSEQILDGIDAVLASVEAGNPFDIRVANLSLGGYDPVDWPPNAGNCDTIAPDFKAAFDALNAAGVTVVAAAGNGGCTVGVAFPACVSSAIAVGAVYDATICTSPAPPPTGCLSTVVSYSQLDGCISSCSSPSGADAVTCYSDSGERLDLWAPADCARAPRMGGGMWDCFSGTSAAAPYASGVAALLAQAFPGATPELLRATLKATGAPITDDRNGITRSRIDALAALASLQGCAAPGTPADLATDVGQTCEGEPVELRWSASSGASGYTVELAHDSGFASVVSTYHTSDPAFNLSLTGLIPFTAYLRVRADAPCGASSGFSDPVAVIYGGACGTSGRQTTFVLGVAHAPGVPPAYFYSDLAVFDAGETRADLSLTFFGSTAPPLEATASLGPRQQVTWQDVLASAFGLTSTDVGLVEVDSTAPVLVLARTYSRPTTSPDRSFGQFVPGLRADEALTAGRVGYFMGLRSDNPFHGTLPFRTNVLFANVGAVAADVDVRFFSNGGAQIGSVTLSGIAPRQEKAASSALPPGLSAAYAEVRASPQGALVIGIASVVDGASTDPTTMPLTIP
jgi:subtilisin family serine protease